MRCVSRGSAVRPGSGPDAAAGLLPGHPGDVCQVRTGGRLSRRRRSGRVRGGLCLIPLQRLHRFVCFFVCVSAPGGGVGTSGWLLNGSVGPFTKWRPAVRTSACPDGYYKLGGSCRVCSENGTSVWIWFVVAIGAVLGVFVLLIAAKQDESAEKRSTTFSNPLQVRNTYAATSTGSTDSFSFVSLSSFNISLNFAQV